MEIEIKPKKPGSLINQIPSSKKYKEKKINVARKTDI